MAILLAVIGALILVVAWLLLRIAIYIGIAVFAGTIIVLAGLGALGVLGGLAGFWVFYNMGMSVFSASLCGFLTGAVLLVFMWKRVKKEIGAIFVRNRKDEEEKAG